MQTSQALDVLQRFPDRGPPSRDGGYGEIGKALNLQIDTSGRNG